ncbi:MAG: hypothetical protein RIE53_08765 [Rhodothermales bacterium]
MSERRDIALELLQGVHTTLLYKDKQQLAAGDLHGFAHSMQRRARIQVWLGIGLAITFSFNGILNLIDYGAGGRTSDLVMGIIAIGAALLFLAVWNREGERVRVLTTQALALLDAEPASDTDTDPRNPSPYMP